MAGVLYIFFGFAISSILPIILWIYIIQKLLQNYTSNAIYNLVSYTTRIAASYFCIGIVFPSLICCISCFGISPEMSNAMDI